VSVFAKVGDSVSQPVESITTSGGWGCSKAPFQSLIVGPQTKKEMTASLQSGQTGMVWFLRILGLLACWGAIHCCLAPISAAADVAGDFLNMIPCCGSALEDILEGIVGFILCLISCTVGCSCGLFIIAIVWLVMRPLYGILMLVGVAVLLGIAFAVKSQCKDEAAAEQKRKKKNRRYSQQQDPEAADSPSYEMGQRSAMIQCQCPDGAGPGMPVAVVAPDGRQVTVIVPDGVYPGMQFQAAV
jgi:hypothetical protein